jgi:hypothetical protein
MTPYVGSDKRKEGQWGDVVPKFEPSFAIKPLQEVSPGTPVIFEGALAFAGINRSAPNPLVILAAHDTQAGHFRYRHIDGVTPNVAVPTGEIVIRPALHSFTHNLNVLNAPAALYFREDEPYIVVHITGPQADSRVLNLKTGALTRITYHEMDALKSWDLGVVSRGEFVPLLRI